MVGFFLDSFSAAGVSVLAGATESGVSTVVAGELAVMLLDAVVMFPDEAVKLLDPVTLLELAVRFVETYSPVEISTLRTARGLQPPSVAVVMLPSMVAPMMRVQAETSVFRMVD